MPTLLACRPGVETSRSASACHRAAYTALPSTTARHGASERTRAGSLHVHRQPGRTQRVADPGDTWAAYMPAAGSRLTADDKTGVCEYRHCVRRFQSLAVDRRWTLAQPEPVGDPLPASVSIVDEQEARVDPRLVDGRGRSISTAILYQVACAMGRLSPGTVIKVRTDPLPAVDSDIRAWCRTTGHELVETEDVANVRDYTIRNAAEVREQPPWAVVISNPGLQELLSPLGFALAAALAGSPIAIYFQGPAVRVLTHSFSEKLPGWQRPFSALARRGLEKAGHPPPHQKLRQLDDLGAQIYICGPSMEHFKVNADELFLPGVHIAAYPTFVEQMDSASVQIFLQ
jgi:predicted peroxiredoxin/TusA-related sulfurtransferase